MKYEYTHFIPENVSPKGATRIVVKDGDGKEVCSIPSSRFGGLTPPTGEPLYYFGLVSDCHTANWTTNWNGGQKLKNALAYFQRAGCKFVIGCGDFTQAGFYYDGANDYNEGQMLNYQAILEEHTIPVFEIFGNHENYYGVSITNHLARAKELTGIPATAYTVSSTPDSDTVEGTTVRPNRYAPVEEDLFILCGQSDSGQVMSADDFTWLGNQLKNNSNRRCFIFVHSYMEGDSGDADNRRENSIFDTWYQTAAFVTLLEQYPNVILFHGHSHMKFEHQTVDPIANYATVKGYKSVHVPSLGNPRDIDPHATTDKDTPEDAASSQCYLVDVYSDCIVLNGLELGTTGVPSVEVLGTLKINT